MATIRSLGLYEPSALPYLVNEGVLPPDPPSDAYRWSCYEVRGDNDVSYHEEVLIADTCVVWSQGGVVKRLCNLSIEVEPIVHAFATWFPSTSGFGRSSEQASSYSRSETGRALVVCLKSQAHIFLLSGNAHVLPLSFDVERALPCPFGFLLQRGSDRQTSRESGQLAQPDLGNTDTTPSSAETRLPRPSLVLPTSKPGERQQGRRRLPRTYSCTDLLSELGIVAASESSRWQNLDDCRSLSNDESLIYVSSDDELRTRHKTPLCVALTVNDGAQTLTVWQVAQRAIIESRLKRPTKKTAGTAGASRRKLAEPPAHAHRASTPMHRGPGMFSESFAGLAQSQGQNVLSSVALNQSSLPEDDFAAQMSRDFGEVGIQTRSARRVSSMLARTDIGAGIDRSTFKEMATGHGTRRSTARARREGSVGSFTERQSLGARRSSFNANYSTFSTGTSFLGVSGKSIIDEGLLDLIDFEGDGGGDDTSDLSKEIGFRKIKTFAFDTSLMHGDSQASCRVLSLISPVYSADTRHSARNLALAILSKESQAVVMINLAIEWDRDLKDPASTLRIRATELRRAAGVADVCTIIYGPSERLLLLTRPQVGQSSLHLEAPWSPSFSLDIPKAYMVFNPFSSFTESPSRRQETGLRRLLKDSHVNISSLSRPLTGDHVVLIDDAMRSHLVHIDLLPKDQEVQRILDVVNFVLPPNLQDSMLVAWWEVSRWLRDRHEWTDEWSTMVVALFTLAVPFTAGGQNQVPNTPRRRKAGFLRSSSGSYSDAADLTAMIEDTKVSKLDWWAHENAWSWTTEEQRSEAGPMSASKRNMTRHADSSRGVSTPTEDSYVVKCAVLAREYVQAPAGEAAFGTNGYLPVAINKDPQIRRTALANILVALHLLYEEDKLTATVSEPSRSSCHNLSLLVVQLSHWMNWPDWTCEAGTYYSNEILGSTTHWKFDEARIEGLKIPAQPFEPPSICHYFENFVFTSQAPGYPTLLDLVGQNTSYQGPQQQTAIHLTPRTFALLSLMHSYGARTRSDNALGWLSECGISPLVLQTLPLGFASIIYKAISCNRLAQGADYAGMLGDDPTFVTVAKKHRPARPYIQPPHDATRDSHSIGVSALDTEGVQRWDASSEADRQIITRLILSGDRRFQEASKLLNQTRPPLVEYSAEADWTEADLLEAQKELAQYVTRRTLSVALGRGMMHFDARVPLLTERVTIPAFSLQCVMKPQRDNDNAQPLTFSADKAVFTEEKVCWAFFHNGASAGLMISKDAKCIDTSWILYNKPAELTNRHAGFLLALGLNGHLRTLAKWVAFKYLTPKHTMTSIGLLLGLSASYAGTMETSITRLLSVHVTRLLPPGAAELNLSPLTQTTGIMGIGLLYQGSQHRRMSEVMLSELENSDSEEADTDGDILRSESYRLAAGFSLGLINLGQGKGLHALHDMAVIERLLTIAIGTKNVNLVHVLDRATAGAVMAVTMIYLKTNDEAVAKKIDIPDTTHQFDYVRPDVFLLRTLARHLILWDRIQATDEYVSRSLPAVYRARSNLQKMKYLSTDDLPFFNIIAGICFAVSLRFAGSQNTQARDLVVHYLDQFLRLSRLPALNYDAKVTMKSVRSCLDVLALSSATIVAGSGDLVVMRRLRALHGRTDKETPYGSHLAAHMALGTLFMAGGTATFSTSNLAIASLLIAFYPLFPSDVLDNRAHLQALRHLWVLAVEHRCLVARNAEDGSILSDVSATIKLKSGGTQSLKLPSLLPELTDIETISCFGEDYWDSVSIVDAALCNKIVSERGLNISMTRRATYDRPLRDILKSELIALDQAARIPNVNSARNTTSMHTTGDAVNPFEWVFNLDSLKGLDYSERALVLGDPSGVGFGPKMLMGTLVDDRLELEHGVLPSEKEGDLVRKVDREALWQMRLLFGVVERFEREEAEEERERGEGSAEDRESAGERKGGSGSWLRREVIENLKMRVWRMCQLEESASDIAAADVGA